MCVARRCFASGAQSVVRPLSLKPERVLETTFFFSARCYNFLFERSSGSAVGKYEL